MNTNDLSAELDAQGVRKSSYSINYDRREDKYCIVQDEDGSWITYYSERGNKNLLKRFATEEEACAYFLSWVLSIPWTRQQV